jgi:hypothetical protein
MSTPMPITPPFGPQLIGQTEKTLNLILARLLAGTGVSEPQWVTLAVAATAGETDDRDALAGRVAGALHISGGEAASRIGELLDAQLLEVSDGDGSVVLSDAGRQLRARVGGAVAETTGRLWGDLPVEDLATAGRVLATILVRANAELASGEE